MSAPQSPASDRDDSSVHINPADLERFKSQVKEFIELPAEIERLNEPVKQLKARQKELENVIIEFMRQNRLDSCNIPEELDGGGLLVTQTSVTKASVKKDNWNNGFSRFCQKRGISGAAFEDLEKEVKSTCDTTTKTVLKRKKTK